MLKLRPYLEGVLPFWGVIDQNTFRGFFIDQVIAVFAGNTSLWARVG
jgi:hypothetical protein